MEIAKDLITALQFLLPGFIAAWVFYGLTSYPKPGQFERIIQALIFTAFIQIIVFTVKEISFFIAQYYHIGYWTKSSELIWSTICAFLFGLMFSYFSTNDKLHRYLRYAGISLETSYHSEWFSALKNKVTYIVLHLKDERRIYGWPIEWPSESTKGHFLLTDASWLNDANEEIQMTGVESILIQANDVKWIEFMEKTWEEANG